MARKRTSSFVESSDDEFQLSDDSGSPAFSRLKRPRRSPPTSSSALPPSEADSSPQRDQDLRSSILGPDSLDDHENVVQEPLITSIPSTPADPVEQDTRDTDPPPEQNAEAEEHNSDVELIFDGEDEHSKSCAENKVEIDVQPKQSAPSARKRKSKTRYRELSESEDDSCDNANADSDAAYESAEDSPPEDDDDDDSEFELTPKKPVKKQEKKPSTKKISNQGKKTVAARNAVAARKAVAKPLKTVKAVTTAGSSLTSNRVHNGKKRLGARIPSKAVMSLKSPSSVRKSSIPSGKLASGPVIRSGLSRKSAVPRLHAYLPR